MASGKAYIFFFFFMLCFFMLVELFDMESLLFDIESLLFDMESDGVGADGGSWANAIVGRTRAIVPITAAAMDVFFSMQRLL